MDVMTMGDSNYYDTTAAIAEQLGKLHPYATFYIYDWGYTDDQRKALDSFDNTEVIAWDVPYTLSTVERLIGKVEKILKYDHFPVSDFLHRHMATDDGYRIVWGPLRRQKEAYMKERIYCLFDCVERSPGPLVLLDADAIPLAPLDLMDEEFDVGVTRRSREKIEDGKRNGKYIPLNGGVVFFNTDAVAIRAFAKEWRYRAENCRLELQEQTSLCRLISAAAPGIYEEYYNTGTLELGGIELDVKVFACDRWNYWDYDSIAAIDPDKHRILHLKSGRHSDLNVEQVIERVTSGT